MHFKMKSREGAPVPLNQKEGATMLPTCHSRSACGT